MPTCNAANYYAAAGFGYPGINPRQRKAIQIRAMILELQAIGGADYRTNFAPLRDAVAKLRELTPEQIEAATTAVYAANATAAGATVPSTVNGWIADSQCYTCEQDNLDLFILELTCQLGEHAP